MTEEKKKAIELVDRFKLSHVMLSKNTKGIPETPYKSLFVANNVVESQAKKFAMLCVDELIKAFENFSIEQHGKIGIDYGHGFWQNVKEEIEKL